MTETTDIAALLALAKVGFGYDIKPKDRAALNRSADLIEAQATRITKLEADCRTWQKTFNAIEIEAKNDAARIEALTGALTLTDAMVERACEAYFDLLDIRDFGEWKNNPVQPIVRKNMRRALAAALAQTPKGKADD